MRKTNLFGIMVTLLNVVLVTATDKDGDAAVFDLSEFSLSFCGRGGLRVIRSINDCAIA